MHWQTVTVLCLLWGFTACTQESTSPWDEETLQLPSGVAASALPDPDSPGAHLEVRFCSQCHGIPSPASHSAADWVPTLRRMVVRMERFAGMGGMMGGGRMPMGMHEVVLPTPEEQRTLLAYLQDHALRTIPEANLPEATGEAAGLFSRTCMRCHALPDPALHTAAEWPSVVERMRQHMQQMNVSGIGDDEAQEITSYLQRAAQSERQ